MNDHEPWRGTIIVRFHPSTSAERRDEILKELGLEYLPSFSGTSVVTLIRVPPGEDERFVEAFSDFDEVDVATLNNQIGTTN